MAQPLRNKQCVDIKGSWGKFGLQEAGIFKTIFEVSAKFFPFFW